MKFVALVAIVAFSTPTTIDAQGSANAVTDKDLHILAGIVASLGSTSLILYANQDDDLQPAKAAIIASVASVGAGIGKEILDSMGLGTPELRDLCNTAFGGVLGVSALMFSFAVFSGETASIGRDLRYTFLTMSVTLSVPILSHLFGW